jgi:hypothetical protein
MERILLLVSLVLGGAGWVCGWLLAPTRRNPAEDSAPLPRTQGLFWFAALLPVCLVFVVTLPAKAPFAAGQGFGKGFLLGGFAALLAAFALTRALHNALPEPRLAPATVAPFALGLATVAAPLLWLRASLYDTLMGVALGWLTATAPVLLGLSRREGLLHAAQLPLAAALGFVLTLCLIAGLGEARNPLLLANGVRLSWSALALGLAAGVPFALLLCALPSGLLLRLPFAAFLSRLGGKLTHTPAAERNAALVGRVLLGAALLSALSWALARRFGQPLPLLPLTLTGFGIALLLWWQTAARVHLTVGSRTGWQSGALAALTVVAGFLAGFHWLSGLGVGLMLLPVWLCVGLAASATLEVAPTEAESESLAATAVGLTRLAFFGTALLIYRFAMARFDNALSGVGLLDHYALIGLMVGATLPTALAHYLIRPAPLANPQSEVLTLGRLVAAAVATLLVPALLLLIFHASIALALIIGAALAIAFSQNATSSQESEQNLWTALLALAGGLALAQWMDHILPHVLLARAEKMRLVVYLIGGGIGLMLLADYGGRFSDWLRRRKSQNAPPQPAKGAAQ